MSAVTRQLYALPPGSPSTGGEPAADASPAAVAARVRDAVIGRDAWFSTALGLRRRIVYCDYVASGRALSFIEDYIREEVLPFYGNTHTTTSVTGLQSTCFRHEARDIVKQACHASEDDALIFTGSGSTGAIVKLRDALNLSQYADAPTGRAVVFVGPFEHHSNLLPWREAAADVVAIGEDASGQVDLEELRNQLRSYAARPLKIGSFSAASNVTGVLTDQNAVTAVLHEHGALAFWDFASAGPYVPIDMNPISAEYSRSAVQKDAVFISPHKFIGGVGTPGVLLAKRSLFPSSAAPTTPGGGSVFYVGREDHRYLKETEWREEAGTPGIVESIRCGMVFQLKQAVGASYIHEREDSNVRRGFELLGAHPAVHVLGPGDSTRRLPVFSFVIEHRESGLFLHHNFVAALLNDLFGIQARGGCACAGPYAQELLGIDSELSKKFEGALVDDRGLEELLTRERDRMNSGKELIRPGFCRISLNYFVDEEEVDFVLNAVRLVADMGWACLPQYTFNADTGEWKHRRQDVLQARSRRWLGAIDFAGTGSDQQAAQPDERTDESGGDYYEECLASARELLRSALESPALDVSESAAGLGTRSLAQQSLLLSEDQQDLRWFMFPEEALARLQTPHGAATRNDPANGVAVNPKRYGLPVRSGNIGVGGDATEDLGTRLEQHAAVEPGPGPGPEPEPEPYLAAAFLLLFVVPSLLQAVHSHTPRACQSR